MDEHDSGEMIQPDPDFIHFVSQLVEKLNEAGRIFAEQAFSVGCSLSIIPVILVLIIAIIGGARSWISIVLTLLGELLIAVVGAIYFAYRARNKAIARVYRDEVAPEINQYIETHQITKEEFRQRALEYFPASELLFQHLIHESHSQKAKTKKPKKE